MLLLVGNLHAQTEVLCGMGTPPSQSQTGTPENGAPCFDVDEVFDNCTPIYLRVNIHFFVPDNCEGQAFFADKTEIGQPDEYINQAMAYSKAETLINNANAALANNPIQWQTNTGGHCIPFRYVLNGVYMHCSTAGQTQGANFRNTLEPFRQNPNTEINIFVSDYAGRISGAGNAFGGTYLVVDHLEKGLLNHEVGHLLNLVHTFDPDAFSDTPALSFYWDMDCDGIEEYRFGCYRYISPNAQAPGDQDWGDENNNGTNDCNEAAPCPSSPCCSWDWIDNNIMGYSKFKDAYTNQQLMHILEHMSLAKCDFITIGGPPPPNAFITQTASDLNSDDKCVDCLILEASYNETSWLLELFDASNNLVYTTGWTTGQATKVCFTTQRFNILSHALLLPNATYKAVLTVKNETNGIVQTDVADYTFTSAPTQCHIDTPPLYVNPNPTDGQIQARFNGIAGNIYDLTATHTLTGTTHRLLDTYLATDGENTITVGTDGMMPGTYVVRVVGDMEIFQTNLVKL